MEKVNTKNYFFKRKWKTVKNWTFKLIKRLRKSKYNALKLAACETKQVDGKVPGNTWQTRKVMGIPTLNFLVYQTRIISNFHAV